MQRHLIINYWANVQKAKSQTKKLDQEALENYRHRLLALRIELSEAFKSKQVSKAYSTKRADKINECLELITQLQNRADGKQKDSVSWLHKFSLKSEDERQLAIQFAQKRIFEAKNALLQVQKFANICRKAKTNETSILWRTFTLSNLLRRFRKLEKSIEHIRAVGKKVESQIQNIVRTSNRPSITPTNIEEMIEMVNKVDEASRRVIEKRNIIRGKKDKLNHMKTWLEQQKQLIRSSAQGHRPPDMLDIQTLKNDLQNLTVGSLEKSRARLTTARKLEAALEQRKPTAPPSTVIQLHGTVEDKKSI